MKALHSRRWKRSPRQPGHELRSSSLRHSSSDVDPQQLMETAMNRRGLSARAYNRILKVARTIADIDGSAPIAVEHISEAIQERSLDRRVS
ncbi:MAG: magnesium chelatase subunit ChlI family protein [Nitrospirota bacterium]